METSQDYAVRYFESGFIPVPVPLKEKAPRMKDWPNWRPKTKDDLLSAFGSDPRNVGVLLGQASGGLVDVDLDCPQAVRIAGQMLPETGFVFGRESRPRSHWVYRTVEIVETTRFRDPADGGTLVECRAEGAQTIFPGSVHPSGETVVFFDDGDPADIASADLQQAVKGLASASLLAKHWPAGSRHDAALALAGGLLRSGCVVGEVMDFVRNVALAAQDEEADDRKTCVETTAENLERGQDVTGWPTLSDLVGEKVVNRVREWLGLSSHLLATPEASAIRLRPGALLDLTDMGNAARFAKQHGANAKYCHSRRKWLIWDEKRWITDGSGEIQRMAMLTVRSLFAEAADAPWSEMTQTSAKWAVRSGDAARLEAMVRLARSLSTIEEEQLDPDPLKLNCLSGTIDLRTGSLAPHNREDCISCLLPVTFDPAPTCPTWETFLHRIMRGNSEMIAFLQRAVGYSLTGLNSEQCLFLLHGNGANGKSTFVNTIRVLMGDYSQQTPVETLMVKRAGGVPNDLARLRGVRFVSAVEAEAGQRLAESLVKQLTGGDAIAARFLYGEFFEFVPQFKLWLATNHRPEIQGMDEAIWRRIHLIPFEVTIPAAERDPTLGDRLCEELAGILAWAVRGCLEWQRIGLSPPERVKAATLAYREESNPIQLFLDDCCQFGSGQSVLAKQLYEAYEHWAVQNLVDVLGKSAFGNALSKMGFASDRTGHGGNRVRIGLTLEEGVKLNLLSGAWSS